MNKQTKQLVLLIGLVVVAGIVAFFSLSGGGDDKKPADDNKAAENPPDNPTPAAPATPASPSNPAPAQPGAKPTTQTQDLEMPEVAKIRPTHYKWDWPAPIGGEGAVYDPKTKKLPPYDPLLVQNIDVVDPQRKKYIEALKQQWVLDGIVRTQQQVPVIGDDGKPKVGPDGKLVTEVKQVLEATFKGKRRPYREKDRLTNTRFTIDKIFLSRVYKPEGSREIKIRDGVDLIGDTGAKLTLFLADDSRYADNNSNTKK